VDEIIRRTEKFITEFRNDIVALNDEEFNKFIESSIAKLLTPPNNLEEFADFFFTTEILTNYLQFDIKERIVNTYRSLTKDDLLLFYDDKFINRKYIIVGINGNKS
jgi:secreted Zn-dependent insulinase-like peptidase